MNATDPTASEVGPSTGQFTVTRSGATTDALTVLYSVGGTAANGVDYTTLTGSVEIGIGNSTATVTVTPITDAGAEPNETVVLSLIAQSTYTIGSPTGGTITLADSPPVVTIQATDNAAAEVGPGTGTFTVFRTGSTGSSLDVSYTIGGTATNGTDYNSGTPLSGTVTIGAGQASTTITVTPVNDADYESDETVVLTLAADPDYAIGSPASATLTIVSDDAPPAAATGHPRVFLTASMRDTIRTNIASDATYRARWQTAVTQYLSTGSYWMSGVLVPYVGAYAAFLACVRTPSDDLGLTWTNGSGVTVTHADLVARAYNCVAAGNHAGNDPFDAVAHGMVYDWVYDYLTAPQRAQLVTWMTALLDTQGYNQGSGIKWISGASHWDDQGTDESLAMTICGIAMEDFATRRNKALQEAQDWATAISWFQFGEGIGYSFKNSVVGSLGPLISLRALQVAHSLSDADTVDRYLVPMRDSLPALNALMMRHAGYPVNGNIRQIRINFQAPEAFYSQGVNNACHLLWALWLLPGKVDLATGADHSHTNLANSESNFLGYLMQTQGSTVVGVATNAKYVHKNSPTTSEGRLHVLYSLPMWLIENVQVPASVQPDTAAIPRIRRWWPDALNWVTMIGGTRDSNTDQSTIVYVHRRWWNNAYTAGNKGPGMWQVFWGGPLLIKRGAASHGPYGKLTESNNGCVTFVDLDNYLEFGTPANVSNYVNGARNAETHKTYQSVQAAADSDFGRITNWHSSVNGFALTSDLTRSYNSSVVAYGGEAPRISSFTREVVATQRGADGTERHRLFVYDRIAVLGSGRYQPRVSLCPPMNPDIDGTETAYTPNYPDPSGRTINEPFEDKDSSPKVGWPWKATGPVRWDYDGASRLIFDGATLPKPMFGGTGPGSGKVCVTWLRPDSSTAVVQKRGGLNAYFDPTYTSAAYNNCPSFDQLGALCGMDGQWHTSNVVDRHQFVGLYGVQLWHETFSANTRFLLAVDVMQTGQTPSTATELTCDAGSVAARCGATAVSFKEATGTRTSGTITIPSGVTYVVLCNLPGSTARTLSAGSGLTITTSTSPTSSASGVLEIGVSGAGVLTFS